MPPSPSTPPLSPSFSFPPAKSPGASSQAFRENNILQVDVGATSYPLPTAVVIDLHTTVVIPDYNAYYGGSISTFRPEYHALGDGSLVAPPLIADLRSANIQLALMSALAMFFLVTTVLSIQYLRRGKIKKKTLFYILLASQVLGLVSIITIIVPFFNQFVSCTSVGFVVICGAMVSYSLLMTGILGIKAYRCLNNSRFVLVILAILRTAMIILCVLDLTDYHASRRLSGSCMPQMNLNIMPIIIILQAAESAFICCCFIYAVWKASRSSIEQGRMSISLSLDDKDNDVAALDGDGFSVAGQARRGWWDYVPDAPRSEVLPRQSLSAPSESHGIIQLVGSKLHDLWSYPPGESPSLHRKPSLSGELPIPRPPRTSTIAFSSRGLNQADRSARFEEVLADHRAAVPLPSPSAMSRLSKYMPRMQVFKTVLKNELYYTAVATVIYVVIAIVMLVGMSCEVVMNPVGWACVSWFAISLFTMHSFGRVVRRHDREAILQNPTAWDPIYRAELEAARTFRKGRLSRRAFSPVSVSSRRLRSTTASDPFEDPRANGSTSLNIPAPGEPGTVGSSRPWAVSRDFSVSSSTSLEESADGRTDHLYTQWVGNDLEVLPSPAPSDCPAPSPNLATNGQRSRSISFTPTNTSTRSSRRSVASMQTRTASQP